MLAETCLLIAFLNTADPCGQTIYPSGIDDDGDYVYSAPPASACPLVNIGNPIVLSGGQVLSIGTYAVMPSQDEKNLVFIEGSQIICELPIIENTIVGDYKATPTVTINVCASGIVFCYQIENILKKAVITFKQDC